MIISKDNPFPGETFRIIPRRGAKEQLRLFILARNWNKEFIPRVSNKLRHWINWGANGVIISPDFRRRIALHFIPGFVNKPQILIWFLFWYYNQDLLACVIIAFLNFDRDDFAIARRGNFVGIIIRDRTASDKSYSD